TLSGPIGTPVFSGNFSIQNYLYKENWTVQQADGLVTFTTATMTASLSDVRVHQGRSQFVLNGSIGTNWSSLDLRVRGIHIFGEDLEPFVKRKVRGTISGSAHVTSLDPINAEGDLRADDLQLDDRLVGNAQSHIHYLAPLL